MEPGLIPCKTEQGRTEIASRGGGLSLVQRRLLILIDGHKTCNDLQAYVRVGEMEPALAHLQACGLIDFASELAILEPAVQAGYSAAAAGEPARAATSPVEFARVRDDAARFVGERLGAAGDPIVDAINRCANPQALRTLLRGVEIFIGQRLDAQTTQAFARHFGALLL